VIEDIQTGGLTGFPLESASVWKLCGLVPESSVAPRLAACLLVVLGVAACGPSGSAGTPAVYAIRFAISETPDPLEVLDFSVAYSGGDFVGTDSSVSCSLLQDDDDEVAEFEDSGSSLSVEITAEDNPLEQGVDIIECDFEASTQPTSANFTITIQTADPGDEDDVTVVVTSTEVAASASRAPVAVASLVPVAAAGFASAASASLATAASAALQVAACE